jgi:hypothetical protein
MDYGHSIYKIAGRVKTFFRGDDRGLERASKHKYYYRTLCVAFPGFDLMALVLLSEPTRGDQRPGPWLQLSSIVKCNCRSTSEVGKIMGLTFRASFARKKLLITLSPCDSVSVNGRDVAQSGSALEWGSRGRWFKSSRPDHTVYPFAGSRVGSVSSASARHRASLRTGEFSARKNRMLFDEGAVESCEKRHKMLSNSMERRKSPRELCLGVRK